LLQACAEAGGGRLLSGDPRTDEGVASALPPTRSQQPIWELLLGAAMVLFFVDVVVRRVILTREDLARAGATVWARIRFKAPPPPSDETMAALLERKKRTFEAGSKPPPSEPAFKTSLHRRAADGKGSAPSAAEQAARVKEPPAKAQTPAPGAPSPAADDAPGAEEASTYTERLLAAKRRARAKKESKEDDAS
jgi:hypothetical protein